MAVITDLPVEILLRIFQFYLEHENQLQLVCVLSKVCKLWKAVCQSSMLWIKFDGTVKYNTMKALCSKGCLDSTKELNVSYTKLLKDSDAEKIFSRLKNVEIINLSQVESFSKNVISTLSQSDLKLKEIQIKITKPSEKKVILSYAELKNFFSLKGANLTTIKLSYCTVQSSSQVLKCISENCANLEHFDFTNISNNCGTFPTKLFQMNCPKLKVLHLDYNISIGAGKHSSGFPNLEVFSYTDESLMSHINDKDIECLLFNSPNLKFLSLTNCSLSTEILCSLPANSVEYLFLPRSKIVHSNNLPDVFKKWCYSLKQADISYSTNMSVNDAMLIFTALPIEPPIEFLDLSYTQVTPDTVKRILEKCRRLEMLHLNGCRNLDRGFKRNYSGKMELRALSVKFKKSAYDDSTDEEMSM